MRIEKLPTSMSPRDPSFMADRGGSTFYIASGNHQSRARQEAVGAHQEGSFNLAEDRSLTVAALIKKRPFKHVLVLDRESLLDPIPVEIISRLYC